MVSLWFSYDNITDITAVPQILQQPRWHQALRRRDFGLAEVGEDHGGTVGTAQGETQPGRGA